MIRSARKDPVVAKPRNLIIQWEQPDIQIKRQVRFLGIIQADPEEYRQKYGTELKESGQLPKFVKDIETPTEIGKLAADVEAGSYFSELEGDLDALKLVNLEAEGLGHYRSQLINKKIVSDTLLDYVTPKPAKEAPTFQVLVGQVTAKSPKQPLGMYDQTIGYHDDNRQLYCMLYQKLVPRRSWQCKFTDDFYCQFKINRILFFKFG